MSQATTTLEEEFKKRIASISDELQDFYEAISDLEQLQDLYELKILALDKPVLVPRIGFLGKYDFDEDENLTVVSEGILRLKNLQQEGIDGGEISLGDKDIFVPLDKEIFLPSFDEEEVKEYHEKTKSGWNYYIPVIEVSVDKGKVLEYSSDTSSSDE
jgi:hypothetical protein